MSQSLRGFFSKAVDYINYYTDVWPVLPSPKVQKALEEKGWQFLPPKEATDLLERLARGSIPAYTPLMRVISPEGEDLSVTFSKPLLKRYDEEKEAAAKQIYKVDGLFDRLSHKFDVMADIPCEKVRKAMQAEGWQFEPSEDHYDLSPMASSYMGGPIFYQPLTVVKTPEGRKVERTESGITEQRYHEAKKRISALAHNIQFS